jgi:hypothetical protein
MALHRKVRQDKLERQERILRSRPTRGRRSEAEHAGSGVRLELRFAAPRRVVAKVAFHFGELFPRVGFIVTSLETDSRAVVRFYNKRGHGRGRRGDTRRLFGAMLQRIAALPSPVG